MRLRRDPLVAARARWSKPGTCLPGLRSLTPAVRTARKAGGRVGQRGPLGAWVITVATISAMRPVSCWPVSPCLRSPGAQLAGHGAVWGSGVFSAGRSRWSRRGRRSRRSGCRGRPGRGIGQAAGLMVGQAALCSAHARLLREMGLEIVKGGHGITPRVGVFSEVADHPEHDSWDGPPTSQGGYLPHRRTTPLPAQSSSSLLPRRALAAEREGRRRDARPALPPAGHGSFRTILAVGVLVGRSHS